MYNIIMRKKYIELSLRETSFVVYVYACAHLRSLMTILDPRALVFYHVTDGDKSSGELYASVAAESGYKSLVAHARAFKNLASVFC